MPNRATLASLMESDFPEGSSLLVYERYSGSNYPREVTILRYSPSKERIKVFWDTQTPGSPGSWMFKEDAERLEVVEVLREGKAP
jgi:hypothetical protein